MELTGIKLKFESGEIEITVDEAKRLLNTLKDIFEVSTPVPPVPYYPYDPAWPLQPNGPWTETTDGTYKITYK